MTSALPFFSVRSPVETTPTRQITATFGGSYAVINPGYESTVPVPENLQPEVCDFFTPYAKTVCPEEFYATIPNGRVQGFGTVISPDGKTIAADASTDWRGSTTHGALINAKRIIRPRKLKGKTAVVAAWGGWGYYHWLIEELPRLISLIRQSDSIDCIISNANSKQSFHREALELLGIDCRTINPRSDMHVECEQLVVPGPIGLSGHPNKRSVELLSVLSEKVGDGVGLEKSLPKHFYISRNRSGRRRIVNEDEILEWCRARNIERVYLEEISLRDQIRLFRNASTVIGTHGAGLSNTVFCQPDTIILEIFSPNYIHFCFWKIAAAKRLRYRSVLGRPLPGKPSQSRSGNSDVLVEPSMLSAILNEAVSNAH